MRTLLFILLIPLLPASTIRVATFNASLSQNTEGQLAAQLRTGEFGPAKRVAEIVQIMKPDVLLLNEFDYDANGTAATRMNDKFFNVSQNGREAQNYPFRYVAISNTGIHSGFDFDNNGVVAKTLEELEELLGPNDPDLQKFPIYYGGDSLGFGEFPGQYGMAVFSKYPIDKENVRTFEEVLWKDMPDNLMPKDFYSAAEQEIFRLSSKSHWDVPIKILGTQIHFLVSHPTPPVFDGPEDRNGRRNHDEIRLWADYLTPKKAGYLGGGLPEQKRFVIAGDQNADPTRGDSFESAINLLLDHPRVNSSFTPERTGETTEAKKFDTSTFRLRVDYVLPSKTGFDVRDGAVFWPTGDQEGANLVTVSDHRLVYLDLKMIPLIDEAVEEIKIEHGGDVVTLSWVGQEQVDYRLQICDDLAEENWESLGNATLLQEGTKFSASFPSFESVRFVRILAGFK